MFPTWLAGVLVLVFAAAAGAQNMPSISTPFAVDIAATNLRPARAPGTPPLPGGTGCANQPLTHDAPIWHLLLIATPDLAGFTRAPLGAYYTKADRERSVFIPVIDVSAADVTLRGPRHTYRSTAALLNGSLQVAFGPMTVSELADLVDMIESDASVGAALSSVSASMVLYEVTATGTAPVNERIVSNLIGGDIDLPAGYGVLRERLRTPHDPSYTSTVVQQGRLATGTLGAASIAEAKNNVRSLAFLSGRADTGGGEAADGPVFVIDEPCLQFSLSPVGTGESGINNAMSFRARYDFLSPDGRGFLKLRAEGNAAEGGSYYDRIEGTLDVGGNRQNAGGRVFSFSGSGTYSYTRTGDARQDEWRFVGRGQINGPNLAEILGTLPGAGMVPLLSFEAGLAGGEASPTGSTDFIMRANATTIARVTRRISVDLRATGGWSNEDRFAGRDRFGYALAQVRINLSSDWDYVIKWECGRKDPDYRDYCGTQSGVAVAVGR